MLPFRLPLRDRGRPLLPALAPLCTLQDSSLGACFLCSLSGKCCIPATLHCHVDVQLCTRHSMLPLLAQLYGLQDSKPCSCTVCKTASPAAGKPVR